MSTGNPNCNQSSCEHTYAYLCQRIANLPMNLNWEPTQTTDPSNGGNWGSMLVLTKYVTGGSWGLSTTYTTGGSSIREGPFRVCLDDLHFNTFSGLRGGMQLLCMQSTYPIRSRSQKTRGLRYMHICDVSFRVQVLNNQILTQKQYYNYYYPNPKYPIIGYVDPLGMCV